MVLRERTRVCVYFVLGGGHLKKTRFNFVHAPVLTASDLFACNLLLYIHLVFQGELPAVAGYFSADDLRLTDPSLRNLASLYPSVRMTADQSTNEGGVENTVRSEDSSRVCEENTYTDVFRAGLSGRALQADFSPENVDPATKSCLWSHKGAEERPECWERWRYA